MITDDLAPLFDTGGPGVRFRQGTVLTWNANTGANTIDLAGGTLTNVPIINTGEAIALKAGHVVGLLGQGSTWFIVGRITLPGDANFAGASVAFTTNFNNTSGFGIAVSPTFSTVASVTLAVPTWADQALVTVQASFSLHNPRGVVDFANARVTIAGSPFAQSVSGYAANGDAGASDYQNQSCIAAQIITNPAATIAVGATVAAGGAAWGADANNFCSLTATAVFRSIA